MPKVFSLEEVKKHDSESSCWIVVDGKVKDKKYIYMFKKWLCVLNKWQQNENALYIHLDGTTWLKTLKIISKDLPFFSIFNYFIVGWKR